MNPLSNAAWHIAVLIPARNEEALLERCLHSVLAAQRRLPPNVSFDLVVVADSSMDDTYRIASALIRRVGLVIETDAACVGAARALAAEAALSRATVPAERCWLANTDADCVVPETWLVDQLARAVEGYVAVAGVIDVDSFAEHDPGVSTRFRLTYLLNPDGTHPHVHGANLGVRADAYLTAGGWNPLRTAEDHDLWNRLKAGRHRATADTRLSVVTSGRRVGRAPDGFADALAAHNGGAA
ncbi:glycosyltransferase [Granulicella sibirica]|uniref:Glycosyl transferase, group 2 family protein n=1 Tax=Granulicella sibirica TaxID=2479048 RepID=A0A4Q0SYA1_9BACT|nr:glycosyltransferase family 2 protein [Granulicella sibirica]RXH53996.1 Glycosyl transferase, group 2 family protein [Granulicella sibirica]